MTAGLKLRSATPQIESILVARVHLPPEQLRATRLHALRVRRDDVSDDQRGLLEREGHGGPALLQRLGAANRARHLCADGDRDPPRLEEDEPAAPAEGVLLADAGVTQCRDPPRAVRKEDWLRRGRLGRADLYRRARPGSPRIQRDNPDARQWRSSHSTSSVIVQEFTMLFRSRAKSGADKAVPSVLWYAGLLPGFLYTLITLPPPRADATAGTSCTSASCSCSSGSPASRGRWTRKRRFRPGQTMQIDHYKLEYINERMEVDLTKRMIFADVKVTDLNNGKQLGVSSPAKFIYKKSPDAPTTEVAQLHSIRDDLYLVVGIGEPADPCGELPGAREPARRLDLVRMHRAHLWQHHLHVAAARARRVARVVVRAVGDRGRGERDARDHSRADAGARVRAIQLPREACAMRNDRERESFKSLRCMCGGCQRLPLSDVRLRGLRCQFAQRSGARWPRA